MLVAVKDQSIGKFTVKAGERITREMQNELPPGRAAVLITHRWLEEIVDEVADSRAVDDLTFRVEKLEVAIAALTASSQRRTPKDREA